MLPFIGNAHIRGVEPVKSLKTVVLAAVAAVGFGSAAFADETTTSTTTRPGSPGLQVGVPGVAGVQIGGTPDCHSKTVTHSNDEGDQVSKTRTNC